MTSFGSRGLCRWNSGSWDEIIRDLGWVLNPMVRINTRKSRRTFERSRHRGNTGQKPYKDGGRLQGAAPSKGAAGTREQSSVHGTPCPWNNHGCVSQLPISLPSLLSAFTVHHPRCPSMCPDSLQPGQFGFKAFNPLVCLSESGRLL